ncbi:MAG: P-type conjugative transfer protein TrbG [Sphingomonadaceae bacterium]|nr:P-type conjugative transfer protein TrbG [Sphingomonadaceae bacterium]
MKMLSAVSVIGLLGLLPPVAFAAPPAAPAAPAKADAKAASTVQPSPSIAVKSATVSPTPVLRSTKPTLKSHAKPRACRGASQPLGKVAQANRAAMQEPEAQGFVNAVQIYPWSEGALYKLYAAPGQVSDIALQPGEQLGAVASGDTARWVIGDTSSGAGEARRTHILVKPFAAGLTNNLVITTDRRTYHLALVSTRGPAMAALSWTYPQEDLLALTRKAAAEQGALPVAAGLNVERLRFDYAISGDKPEWRPVRAFDDGRQTFIEFAETITQGDAPPLFLLGPKGEAELVNYRMSGRYYVVDRLFDVAELRLGLNQQQVVRITRTTPRRRRGA